MMEEMAQMEQIERIIKEEWQQFQKVQNEGGRASCQDEWETFHIMRKSQFLTWPMELLTSYEDDLTAAVIDGRNLVFEKYAFMMEYTNPEKFEELKEILPPISPERRERIQETAAIQADWAKEFAHQYPMIAGTGRPIYSTEDTKQVTSVETYERGELESFSEDTEKIYHDFVLNCKKEGKNLAKLARENMVKLYGYHSLEQAEKQKSAEDWVKKEAIYLRASKPMRNLMSYRKAIEELKKIPGYKDADELAVKFQKTYDEMFEAARQKDFEDNSCCLAQYGFQKK